MTQFVLTEPDIFLGADEISVVVDGLAAIEGTANMVRSTTAVNGGFEHFLPGLASFRSQIVGNVDYASGQIGANITPANRGTQYALTVAPQGISAAGDTAIIHRGLLESFKAPLGQVGEMARFELAMTSDLVQTVGYVGAPPATYTTAGLTGTAVALTGPSATQSLYAALHVTAASGTNLAVKVQSDDGAGFASPTDRVTFSTVSATGWQFSSVAGDLSTETHWRVVATIASGTFNFVCSFGVA